MKKRILIIFGTRPEAIKLASLIDELSTVNAFETAIVSTGQHKEMLNQVTDFFKIKIDEKLEIMKENQTLSLLSSRLVDKLQESIDKYKPQLIVVQGDTTTAFIGALVAFYNKIPIAHVEAGLRTNNKYSPFPEEMNRKMISHLGDIHFAPTQKARKFLTDEGINSENIHVVGNTVIDSLFLGLSIINKNFERKMYDTFSFLDFSKKIILITGHRRENFGEPLINICHAIKKIAQNYPVEIVFPVHLNPNVSIPVNKILKGINNIHLIPPLDYPRFIWLMNKSYFILTDSGGIQEEAPSLKKPVLVMRESTERKESVELGVSILVGTDSDKIYKNSSKLLNDKNYYNSYINKENPYGDGKSSKRIVKIIKKYLINEG